MSRVMEFLADESGFLETLVPKLAGGLLGKLFGRKKKKTGTDFGQLRRDAEAAGFNALTALRATGAMGYNRAEDPSLSSNNFIAQAVEEGATNWFNERQKKKDAEAEKIRRDLSREQAAEFRQSERTPQVSDSYGYSVSELTEGVLTRPVYPKARPTIDNIARVPVMMPDGSVRQIPASVAARLDIAPWGYVTAGDYAELVGEIRGEGEGAIMMTEIGQAVGAPILADETDRQRKARETYEAKEEAREDGERMGIPLSRVADQAQSIKFPWE